jgi:hypothetical protein
MKSVEDTTSENKKKISIQEVWLYLILTVIDVAIHIDISPTAMSGRVSPLALVHAVPGGQNAVTVTLIFSK